MVRGRRKETKYFLNLEKFKEQNEDMCRHYKQGAYKRMA